MLKRSVHHDPSFEPIYPSVHDRKYNSKSLGTGKRTSKKQHQSVSQTRRPTSSAISALDDMSKSDMRCKTYYMNVGYHDLRKALRRRGWLETDNINEPTDLKFTYALADLRWAVYTDKNQTPDTTLINHCKAEGCMTCKT